MTDVREVRSAQIRASRNRRRGKVFGRSVVAVFAMVAMVAAALLLGRPYLFPVEWDARLVSVVDEVQSERGGEFATAVPLIEQTDEQYGATVASVMFGSTWAERLPEWRALGLADGAASVDDVAGHAATLAGAIYDPTTETIYMRADAGTGVDTDTDVDTGTGVDTDTDVDTGTGVDTATGVSREALRLALEQAYADQLTAASAVDGEVGDGTFVAGFAGLVPVDELVGQAIDRALIGVDAGITRPSGVADDARPVSLPVPVEYHLTAVDELGGGLLDAAALDPATARVGDEQPEVVIELLSDEPIEATTPSVRAGDVPVLGPVSLGVDDWTLVWSARLPAPAVDELAGLVRADSYRTVTRADRTCAMAVFQSVAANADQLTAALQSWAAAAPPASETTVTRVGPRLVQIDACDPGETAGSPDPSGVRRLIDAQARRLAAG